MSGHRSAPLLIGHDQAEATQEVWVSNPTAYLQTRAFLLVRSD